MAGHSVERFYKLHGYPKDFKDNKIVAAVAHAAESSNTNTTISVEQYQQVMEIFKKKNIFDQQTTTHHAMLAGKICLASDNVNNSTWVIDSDANDHICSNICLFTSYKLIFRDSEFIVIPDGTKVPILHTGTFQVFDLVLLNVLHISLFKYNLIFVKKFWSGLDCSMIFICTKCLLQSPL